MRGTEARSWWSFLLRQCFVIWLVALAGLSVAEGVGASSLEEVKARGRLTMLCFPYQTNQFVHPKLNDLNRLGVPLTELRDPQYYEGLDVELMKAFAAEIGVALEIRPVTTSYQGLIAALQEGQGDLAAGSLTITEERSEVVDFSEPYLFGWTAVVARRGSPIASIEDLADHVGVVMRGSSQHEFLRTMGHDPEKIRLTDFTVENLVDVSEGEADFTILDTSAAVGESPATYSSDLAVAFRLRQFGYGIAVGKGSDLADALNEFFRAQVERGRIAELAERWVLASK